MSLMFPMLSPKSISIDTGNNKAGDSDAGRCEFSIPWRAIMVSYLLD